MSANALLSDQDLPARPFPAYLRAHGAVKAGFRVGHRGTRIADLYETGGFRLKFPHPEFACAEAILVNTGGGMTGGDTLDVAIHTDAATNVLLTTQSAEKIYRSNGGLARITSSLTLGADSTCAWIPQETILFSGATIARALHVTLPKSATLLAAESIVFGRAASGEILGEGFFSDTWRITREGKLIFAENTRLVGDTAALLARKAIADGARSMATLVLVAPDAEAALEPARAIMQAQTEHCALSAWNGMMVARLLNRDAQALRLALARLIVHLRGAAMPRVWQC